MSLRRGFKAEANRIAVRLRSDLGLRPYDPMDLDALGRMLDVPIVPLSFFAKNCGSAVRQLTHCDRGAFSAVTLPRGEGQHFILHNDGHAPVRQRSNISHEFAHIALKHPMTLPLDSSGCRSIDRDIEEEANWLGGAILISDPAALHILSNGMSETDACARYGVSMDMLRFRINASGARIRMSRWQRN